MSLDDHYAVVYKADREAAAVFEGTEADVFAWLKQRTNRPQNLAMWEIWHSQSTSYTSILDFMARVRPESNSLINLVDRHYSMNSETEVLVPNGGDLENGMMILLAASVNRCDLKSMDKLNAAGVAEAHVTNRWCSISQVSVSDGWVSFLARYEDGVKKQRRYPTSTAWLVKTDGSGIVPKKAEPLIPDYYLTCMPKFYKMNPETEELLPDGSHLANGMKVLVNDSDVRMRVGEGMKDWEMDRALANNQWCTISNLEIERNGAMISFIGTYEDGTKRNRRLGRALTWLVKLDSISGAVEESSERYTKVYELVRRALLDQDALTEEYTSEGVPDLDRIAENTTKQILGIL